MRKVRLWLTGAGLAATAVRLLLPVVAALAAGGDPLVAFLAALGQEGALQAEPPPLQ